MAFADDYIPVNERLERFLGDYPEGRIQTEIWKHTDTLVIVKAYVYRDATDERPTTAHSQLSIPGKTNFTRDSEVENAETSAVGRALALMGYEIKKAIASREEVAARQEHREPLPPPSAKPKPTWQAGLLGELNEHGMKMADLSSALGEAVTPGNYAELINRWLQANPGQSVRILVRLCAPLETAGVN